MVRLVFGWPGGHDNPPGSFALAPRVPLEAFPIAGTFETSFAARSVMGTRRVSEG